MSQGYSPPAMPATSLPSASSSPTHARAFARQSVAGWNLTSSQCDDVLLVVDELVTNAVVHGRGTIGLSLDLVDDAVRIEVVDESSALPTPRRASTTRTGGRGIALVAAIAATWGAVPAPAGGKCVWAEIPISR